MGTAVVFGGLALLFLLGGGGRRRSSSPRGSVRLEEVERVERDGSVSERARVEMGEIRTTADIQSARLGIGAELWRELVRVVNARAFRARAPFRAIAGPNARIEAWLRYMRDLRAQGETGELLDEASWMRQQRAPLAAQYAEALARPPQEAAEAVEGVDVEPVDVAGYPVTYDEEGAPVVHNYGGATPGVTIDEPIAPAGMPQVVVHGEGDGS